MGNIEVDLSLPESSGLTDIHLVNDTEEKENYDLSGRRISSTARGLVIERANGKTIKKIKR